MKNDKVLVLRTCNEDMTSKHDSSFRYPKRGPVETKTWDPNPVCGGGLHGFLWGQGDSSLADWSEKAKWLVLEVSAKDLVVIDGGTKVKFKCGKVIYAGTRDVATSLIDKHAPNGTCIMGGTATAGYAGTATAGDSGTATAGYAGTATAGARGTATAGDSGTATAGDSGTATAGTRGTATAGTRGTATAGDLGTATAGYAGTATAGYAGTATAGYAGTATAGYAGTATAGDSGTATAGTRGTATAGTRGTATAGDSGTATAGDSGIATAGELGIIQIKYWDQPNWSKSGRYRIVTGYVGENGIEKGVKYRLNEKHELESIPAIT